MHLVYLSHEFSGGTWGDLVFHMLTNHGTICLGLRRRHEKPSKFVSARMAVPRRRTTIGRGFKSDMMDEVRFGRGGARE